METAEIELLRTLLYHQPVAALSTLHKGRPAVSMVPFAVLPATGELVIHVSTLATHTGDMVANPAVAMLITGSPGQAETPLALPRVSFQGEARVCPPDTPEYEKARCRYLEKLPDAEPLFSFSDFSLFLVSPESVRFVAGFGRARSISPERLREILSGDGNDA